LNDTPSPPVAPGRIIGERYRVGPLLGGGGMGVVCEAIHIGLDVPVAIKFIRPDLRDNSEYVQRFLNEARRAATLKNEHVARVHDVGQLESGELYLVMERLDGVGVDALIREHGPLPQIDAVNLVLEACEGLSEAHAAGIVHRDIKPENLFLARRADGKRTLKILDFGISKQTTDDAPSSLTNSERSLGSPWYMSPEQMIDTSSVDHRADVWSLGVVLFELLTGTRPFEGGSVPEVCAGVLTAPAPALRARRPDADPGLEAIVLRCLAKNPAERPANVTALAHELEPFASPRTAAPTSLAPDVEEAFFDRQSEVEDSTKPPSVPPLSRRSTRRKKRARNLGILGILASLALTVLAFLGALHDDRPVRSPEAVIEPVVPPAPIHRAGTASPPPSANPVTVAPVSPVTQESTQATTPDAGSGGERDLSHAPRAAPPETGTPTASELGRGARPPRVAPPSALTEEEVRRRKERYERWLREQGLQRVDEVVVPQPAEAPEGQASD
jgi:serine/threonine-protein kinase